MTTMLLPASLHPKLRTLFAQSDTVLPPFRQSASTLIELVSSDATSGQQLSKTIINDPGLSSRVLRLANSLAFSPTTTISSVHHAVVWLGMDHLRTIVGTIKLLDELIPSIKHSPHLMRLMTGSILAAAQATELGNAIEYKDLPNLYTRTLLFNMVDMMLVYQAPELYDALMTIQRTQKGILTDDDERSVLGVTRRHYGELLAQSWHMPAEFLTQAHQGHNLLESLPPPPWTSPKMQRTGLLIASNLLAQELNGPHDKARIAALRNLIQLGCQLPPLRTERLLANAVDKGHQVLQSTGMSRLQEALDALPPEPTSSDETTTNDIAEFQDVSTQSQDINALLNSFIKALHTTLKFNRVALALLDPQDTSRLIGRYLIGADPQQYLPPLTGSLNHDHRFFLSILKRTDPLLVSDVDANIRSQFSPHFLEVWAPGACLLGPIRIKNRPIGLIYADFGPSSPSIPVQTLTRYHMFYAPLSEGLIRLTQR